MHTHSSRSRHTAPERLLFQNTQHIRGRKILIDWFPWFVIVNCCSISFHYTTLWYFISNILFSIVFHYSILTLAFSSLDLSHVTSYHPRSSPQISALFPFVFLYIFACLMFMSFYLPNLSVSF